MDMPVKDSPGLCRCCFSEGCYKDLSTAYAWMGDTEIYADMLLECFDISITQHVDGPNGPNRLICEVCITRLRDASNFKKQVLNCEKKFIDMVAKGAFKASTSEFNVQVSVEKEPKLEPILEEDIETPNLDYLDDLDYDDDFDPKGEASTSHQSDDNEPLAKLTTRKRKLKPKKETATKAAKGKAPKVVKKEEKPKATKKETPGTCVAATSSNPVTRLPYPKNRNTAKLTVMALLIYSTALPFKWTRNQLACFFCSRPMHTATKLREHTIDAHDGSNLSDVGFAYKSKMRVKVDIAGFHCKKCPFIPENLSDMFEHMKMHGYIHKADPLLYVRAFRLSDDVFNCIDCEMKFSFFSKLINHSNSIHFPDEVCIRKKPNDTKTDKAGSNALKMEPKDENRCTKCHKLFSDTTHLMEHMNNRHGAFSHLRVITCEECGENFRSTHSKWNHQFEKHGIVREKFPCKYCPMEFYTKSRMLAHSRQTHDRERNFVCQVCGFRSFNGSGLRHHMTCHRDDKPFECPFCQKNFSRKKSLKTHVRIHTNDRRCVCKFCGKAFVQHTSLKLHIKGYHPESLT